MLNKILHFIKYNNATVIILALVLILGGGALAAGTETIGQKKTSVQGVDNTALLAVDLDSFNMDFKIENLEQDEKYYYLTYNFLDLTLADGVWQYQLSQRTQKVSRKIKEDLGVYLAKFLAKHYEARTRELKREKSRAQSRGEQKRMAVTAYTGLIGRTLDLAAKVFPGYEPVVKRELPAPENFNLPVLPENRTDTPPTSGADNLTRIYNEYVAEHPEIFSPPTEPLDSAASSTAADSGQDGSPPAVEPTPTPTPGPVEMPVIPEPATVDIIELPVPPSTSSGQAAPEPVVMPEPTPTAETTPVEPAPAAGQ